MNLQCEIRKSRAGGFLLDASFEARPGITILFGASGAGKTSLLDCIAGLLEPENGRIAIGERILFHSAQGVNLPVAARKVGYVFQTLALFPNMSVSANVEYGLARSPADERRARALRILENFQIAHLQARRPREISGGERQRVALARALVTDPAVLLLDEPLSGLDAPTHSLLLNDLRAWNSARQIPVLYVTHSRQEAFALGERLIVLENGRVLAQGSPQEVLEAPHHEAIAQLAGIENRLQGTVAAWHEADGTMTCRFPGSSPGTSLQLEVPLGRLLPGAAVRVGIRAGDILLANSMPHGISARNVIPGQLVSLWHADAMAVAQADCGLHLQVHLTPAAARELDLQPGRGVWLIIKTHACHLLQ